MAEAIRQRRSELGLTQKDVWRRGGPANSTLTALEGAVDVAVTPSTLRKVDDGLGWEKGTAASLLHGGRPAAARSRGPRLPDPVGELIEALRDVRSATDRAVRSAERLRAHSLEVAGDDEVIREFLRRFPDAEALQARLRA